MNQSSRVSTLAAVTLLVVSAIWGAHAVIGAQVIRALSPLALTTWRFTFAALLFAFSLPGALVRSATLSSRDRWALIAAGLLWAVFYPLFYYRSLAVLPPVESLLLVNGAPVVAAILAFVFLHERLRRLQVLGLAVAFAGVVLISVQTRGGGAQDFGAIADALIGTISFAAYTVLSRSLFGRLKLFDVLAFTTVIGAVSLWLITLVSGQVVSVYTQFVHLHGSEWLQFAFIAFIVSGLAYVLYGYGLSRVETGLASALTFYPQAFFAALLQWLTIGLTPSVSTVTGGVIILLGTFFLQWRKPSQKLG
ncbi:MAG: DMT family transporter [Firmicutes bacterium]|nr:DMT family transporter [Bacillota bacterium]